MSKRTWHPESVIVQFNLFECAQFLSINSVVGRDGSPYRDVLWARNKMPIGIGVQHADCGTGAENSAHRNQCHIADVRTYAPHETITFSCMSTWTLGVT